MQKSSNTFDPSGVNKDFLSSDPRKAMQEMMDMIDRMRDVYVQETDALERYDARGFLGLQEQKLEVTKDYKAGIENILSRKEDMRNVDPALKKELERMQNDFADLSSKNLTALKRMQKTMGRLGDTVQKAAKDSVNKQRAFSYGDSGKLQSDETKRVSIGVSETA